MKKEDTQNVAAASAPVNAVEAAKSAVQAAFPNGVILVGAFVAGSTQTRTGKSKKDGSDYTMSTTQAVVGGRFTQLLEYSRAANARHQQFSQGNVVVQARSIAVDPKNPSILRISLTDIEDVL